MCCSVGVAVLGGANPGEIVVVVVVANSWLVCTGVLKPVLKLAWRCWVGRTPGKLSLSCCLVVLSPTRGWCARGAEAGAEASVAVPGGANPGEIVVVLSCWLVVLLSCCRQLVAGMPGVLKPMLKPVLKLAWR